MSSHLELVQMIAQFSTEYLSDQDDFQYDINSESSLLGNESMLSEYEAAFEAPQALAAYMTDQLDYE